MNLGQWRGSQSKLHGLLSSICTNLTFGHYRMIRPQDLDYKPSARRKSTLIVARLYDDDPNGEVLLNYVKKVLETPKCKWRLFYLLLLLKHLLRTDGQPPVARLRTALLHLRNPTRFNAVREGLLSMLSKNDMTEGISDLFEMATSSTSYASELVSAFGTTLKLQKAYLRFTLSHSCAVGARCHEPLAYTLTV